MSEPTKELLLVGKSYEKVRRNHKKDKSFEHRVSLRQKVVT